MPKNEGPLLLPLVYMYRQAVAEDLAYYYYRYEYHHYYYHHYPYHYSYPNHYSYHHHHSPRTGRPAR